MPQWCVTSWAGVNAYEHIYSLRPYFIPSEQVKVNLKTGRATVYTRVEPLSILRAVQRIGYEARLWKDRTALFTSSANGDQQSKEQQKGDQVKTLNLQISGMSCGSCVKHIEDALRELPGVEVASVQLMGQKGKVAYHAHLVTPDKIAQVSQK